MLAASLSKFIFHFLVVCPVLGVSCASWTLQQANVLSGVVLCRSYDLSCVVQSLPALVRAGDPVWSRSELGAAYGAVLGGRIAPVTLVVEKLDLVLVAAEADDRLLVAAV